MQVWIAFWLITSLSFSAVGKTLKGTSKTSAKCNAKSLKAQDCLLKAGTFEINLLSAAVAWNDGTWRTVEAMPLKGEGIEWDKISFEVKEGWPILQLWLWDSGVGEAKVQSLNWYVVDLADRKMKVLAQGVVRKRRLRKADVDASGVEDPKVKKPGFILEKTEEHHWKLLNAKRAEWRIGTDKKIIERPSHGI